MKERKILMLLLTAFVISMLIGCGKTESTTVTEPTVEVEAAETEAIEAKETPEPEMIEPTKTAESETIEITETTEPEQTETLTVEPQATYTYTDMTATMYAQQTVNVRDLPNTDGNKIGSLSINDEITITGKCNETDWLRFEYNGNVAFVSNKYVSDTKVEIQQTTASIDNNNSSQQDNKASSQSGYFYQNPYGQTLTMTYDEVRAEASKKYPLYQIIDTGSNSLEIYYICNHFRDNPTTPPIVSFAGSAELDALMREANELLDAKGVDWQGDVERYDYYDGHNYSVQKQIFKW